MPRFSLGDVAAPARQLPQLEQRLGNLQVRGAVRGLHPSEYLAQKTPGLVEFSAVRLYAREVPADDCARW